MKKSSDFGVRVDGKATRATGEPGLRVLLVEDSPADAELILRNLRRGGYNPVWHRVETREEMSHALRAEEWDLIVCDFKLPSFDGVRALAEFHQHSLDIPFIVVSGTIGEDLAVETVKAGASDYIMKDRLERLALAVKRELRDAEVRRERHNLEEAMRHASRQWRATFDAINDPIFLVDPFYKVLRCNRALKELTGLSFQEIVGRNCTEILQGLQVGLPGFTFEDLEKSQKRLTGACTVDNRVFEIFMDPLEDDSSKLMGAVVVLNDITESRAAERNLRLFRSLLDRSNDAIEVIDHQTLKILDANETACRQLGFSREEILVLSAADIDLAFSEEQRQWVAEHLKEDGAAVFESQHRRKDGSRFAVEISLNSATIDRPYIISVARDITQRKRTETELQNLARFPAENPQPVLRVDDHGVLVYANPASGPLLEEWTGHVGEELPKRWREIILGQLREGTTAILDAVCGDRAYSLTIVPVPAARYTNVYGRDTTQEHVLERQFHQAQKMEAVGRLAGGIAHDYNNMMTAISGFCEIILMRTTDSEVRSYAEKIKEACLAAASITEQLLVFSRKRGGTATPRSLNETVSKAWRMVQQLVRSEVSLRLSLEATADRVQLDSSQIDQILLNLVINANDAIPGSGSIAVCTGNTTIDSSYVPSQFHLAAGLYAVLLVMDTGGGIEEQFVGKIFEPFFSTKSEGRGTGLGLSVVYGIVRDSGGDIRVESTRGKGTTFEILLPVAKPISDPPMDGP